MPPQNLPTGPETPSNPPVPTKPQVTPVSPSFIRRDTPSPPPPTRVFSTPQEPSMPQIPVRPIQSFPPIPSTPPEPPVLPPQSVSRFPISASPSFGNKTRIILIISILIVVLVGAAAVYAYFIQIGPFVRYPYNPEQMATSVFKGLGNIKSASYSLNLDIAAQPLDPDAQTFNVAVPQNADRLLAYKRDQDKVRDANTILNNLRSYSSSHASAYPSSIAALDRSLNISQASQNSFTYAAVKNSADFSLTIPFETSDAIDAIASIKKSFNSEAIVINGKNVTISNGPYYSLYLPAEPKQPMLVNILNMQSSLSYVPLNFKLNGTLSGSSQKLADGSINGKVHLTANTDVGDITVSIDTEFRKVASDFYVLISKFPTFFIDISKLKGKWIRITPDDLAAYGSSYLGSSPQAAQGQMTAAKEQTTEGIKLFLSLADQDHALVSVGTPVRETIVGVRTYRYDLEFNKDTLAQFYSDLTDAFQKKFGDKNPMVFDQATLDYLKSPEFSQAFEYFRKNTALTLWADKDGTPIQAQYGLRLVPDMKPKVSDRQIRLTVTLTLQDINKPLTTEVPTGSISVEDATIAMTGQTKEQYEFDKQIHNIQAVQNALNAYHDVAGVFPSTLAELKQTRAEVKKASPKPPVGNKMNLLTNTSSTVVMSMTADTYYDATPFLKDIPSDVFSKSPYSYACCNAGSDYSLIYTMKLPPYTSGTLPGNAFRNDPVHKKLIMTAVEGINTAHINPGSISKEADEQSKIDTDGDGVPDILENYLGTNRLKKDTDGDGHSDYDELVAGTDPLGPGNLKNSGSAY